MVSASEWEQMSTHEQNKRADAEYDKMTNSERRFLASVLHDLTEANLPPTRP